MSFQFGSRSRGHFGDDDGYDQFVDNFFGFNKKKKAEPQASSSPQVSSPGDAQEKEADQIASQVSAGEKVNVDNTLSAAPSVQMKQEGNIPPEVSSEFNSQLNASKSGGQTLPENTRTEMEKQMGTDFSGVKLHTGTEADALSKNVHAKAFTHGQDIYFRKGQFDPNSNQGKQLLAHELVHTRQQGAKAMIQRDEETNTYKVTDRISSNGTINQFALRDENGNQISYGEGEEASGSIFLPEGTKVVKLPANPRDPNYIGATVWYKGKYRQGYIHKSAFGNPISEDSAFAAEAFITDAERTVHSAETLYTSEKKRQNESDTWRAEFIAEILEVKNAIQEYKDGKLKITNDILKAIRQEDISQIQANAENKPATLQKLTTDIYSTYNPQQNGQQTSEAILFVPLTPEWFNSNPITQQFYRDVWENPDSVVRGLLEGGSGDVLRVESDISKAFVVFDKLRTLIHGNTTLENTPEGRWIKDNLPESASQTQAIIFIHDGTWTYGSDSPSYGVYVPLEQSFGMLRSNPIMSVMAHEMHMAVDNFAMGETHITPDETKLAWKTAQEPGGLERLMKDPEHMDDLFQSHSGSGIIILSHYFKRIKNKQQ